MSLRARSESLTAVVNGSGTTIGVINAAGSSAFAGQPACPAGYRIAIYAMMVGLGTTASTVLIQDTTPTSLSQIFAFIANQLLVVPDRNNFDPWWVGGLNQGIQITLGSSGACSAQLWYLAVTGGQGV